MTNKSWCQEQAASGRIVSIVRQRGERTADSQLTFFLFTQW